MRVGEIIAALLLPPLAVFLEEGLSRSFWLDAVLTCLAFVPGIIFAFYVLGRDHRAAKQAA
jgi:uncharacterized membrane protein YqaE (UPF0057 family)